MKMVDKLKSFLEKFKKNDQTDEKVSVQNDFENMENGGLLDKLKVLLKFMGPGLLVSIAYLDPGNLLSDIQSGAAFNYRLIWVLCTATFLGFLMQVLSSRLGIVTGKHLALICHEEYGDRTALTISLWLISEMAIIASDIPEVVGSAFGMQLLFGFPLWLGVLIVSFNTFILLGIQYFGIRKLEFLITLLIAAIGICFMIESFLSPIEFNLHVNCPNDKEWDILLQCSENKVEYCPDNFCGSFWGGFVPRINADTHMLFIALSIIGAVVMPHNLFLHSALVLSRDINRRSPYQIKWADRFNQVECFLSLLISCIINTSVMIVSASVFFPNEYNSYRLPQSLMDIGFTEASTLLQSTLGSDIAPKLFGIALLASGQSSTITGTYAGQFVMEGFIDIKMELWKRNILTRAVAIVPSLVICLMAGKSGANTLIIASSVLLSFQLPFALVPLLKFTSSPLIMGPHRNSKLMIIICSILSTFVVLANVCLIYYTLLGNFKPGEVYFAIGIIGCIIATVLYFAAIAYLIYRPIRARDRIYDIVSNDEIITQSMFDLSDVQELDDIRHEYNSSSSSSDSDTDFVLHQDL